MSFFKYKYKCPYCGYESNNKNHMAMRICPNKPALLKIFNPHCWALKK